MIGRLVGRLASKATDHVILDVGGVGYLVQIPLSTFYELPEAESPASLWIHTHVREDALALYGFLTERERSLFLMLIDVAGIGPRVALTVLSGIPPTDLVEALRGSDVRRLMAVPGVGKKTAERMVLELAEKASKFAGEPSAVRPAAVATEDVVSALVNLGYRKGDAERAVDGIGRAGAPKDFGDYLKLALKKLTGG
ncbi:MAG: Holliday junction branch migration protein RuvA [Acidobacteria bacterium]|nr:MAG: Holliday junction branch migration protein RuvA [Acidobacteriota bacterium]PYQ67505.1 MAG: Holliday junction branch migration protein RuvA [Acidobacteriota bacterium]